jgi:hypothetical protein
MPPNEVLDRGATASTASEARTVTPPKMTDRLEFSHMLLERGRRASAVSAAKIKVTPKDDLLTLAALQEHQSLP